MSGSKIMCGFCIILVLKGIMKFKVKESKISVLIKQNRIENGKSYT